MSYCFDSYDCIACNGLRRLCASHLAPGCVSLILAPALLYGDVSELTPSLVRRQAEAPRRSPERTHLTNFMRANSPEPPRRPSPLARRSPLAAPPPPPLARPARTFDCNDRPHSEPPKRKAYARDEVGSSLNAIFNYLRPYRLSLFACVPITNYYL